MNFVDSPLGFIRCWSIDCNSLVFFDNMTWKISLKIFCNEKWLIKKTLHSRLEIFCFWNFDRRIPVTSLAFKKIEIRKSHDFGKMNLSKLRIIRKTVSESHIADRFEKGRPKMIRITDQITFFWYELWSGYSQPFF